MNPDKILIVDDDMAVRELMSDILECEGFNVKLATNGKEALEMILAEPFDLILTDICMPLLDGIELIKACKGRDPDLSIIVLAGIRYWDLVTEALKLGAYDYLMKPLRQEQITFSVRRALEHRRLVLENREYKRLLEQRVQERTSELQHALDQIHKTYQETLQVLGCALDVRDVETRAHSWRVTFYASTLAQHMGISGSELMDIERGVYLHDIGNVSVPESILLKPGKLTSKEWEIVKRHPEMGYRMIKNIDFLRTAPEIVYAHHERWDGKGYPRGLKGKQIPVGARILSVVDAIEAMTTGRPYREAVSFAQARQEIARCSGTQFDPEIVEAFMQIQESDWQRIRQNAEQAAAQTTSATPFRS